MRASGVLLHPTSLPGKFGIGDLGQEAYDFVDFLAGSFQQIWQVLPLGPTGFGNSPYLCYSALAGNPLLISLEQLQKEELLSKDDLASLPEYPDRKVNYDLVVKTKIPLLKTASDNFKTNSSAKQQQKFAEFCQQHAEWLDDYVLFMALKESFNGASWNQWEEKVAKRDSVAIAALKESLKDEIFFHKFLQFEFFSQWTSLKTYANKKGIQIFGDIPIYVAHDSADVWSHPEIFQLDKKTGEAALMAGVPPDYFSDTGQLWGNPVYDWETLKATEFKWWIERVKAMLEQVDLIR
ncbi:MAG: 4-alpha-glucanotransferase, partial [Xenococcaceae cyanobacterium]